MHTAQHLFRTFALSALMILGAAIGISSPASAASEVNIVDGYAVHGHDVVAYFTQGKPVAGNDRFTARYQGADYRFASAANRDRFKADPARYAPQYGGYCAFGAAMGRKFNGDPNAWKIVDDKLYLNLNKSVQERWSKDIPGFVRGADNNWPLIRSITDASLEAKTPAGVTQGAQ